MKTEKNIKNEGRFLIKKDDKLLAELKYTISRDNELVLVHTEVQEAARGKGLGKELVSYAVKFARKFGMSITSECNYARKIIIKNPELQDVLKNSPESAK